MKFPTFVYKSPGFHPGPNRTKTYQYMLVEDEKELKQRLSEGWYATMGEAIDPPAKPAEAPKPAAKTAEPVKPKA